MHGNPERTRLLAETAAFIALIAAGAWVAIPVGPVPVTLQTFFLLLAAPVMKRRAIIPAALYLLLGAANLPVFHSGLAGIGVLLGPSGGFLAGFIPAAAVAGFAYGSPSRILRGAGLAAGTLVIYVCGVAWLLFSAGLSLPAAVLIGVVPFLPGDILKGAGVFLLGERLP
ncbi:MAG TPA: biotin transporter BioY [Methanomicrobiales archaeon]|nr:biotin transporter BioY [Methanomicrobiales archaeon]